MVVKAIVGELAAVPVANAALIPAGRVAVLKVTAPLKPFTAVTRRLVETLPGRTTLRLELPGVSVKVGTVMVSVSWTVLLSLPELPVMVSG
jgi:hypothetical protein